MKTDIIFDAMNALPDDMILDAGAVRAKPHPRRSSILRTALIAAVMALLLSVTAYAAGGSLAGQHSSSLLGLNWTSLNKLPRAEKRLGLKLTVPERFENGFAFERMTLQYTEVTDDAGETVETFPELNVYYGAEGKQLSLDIMAERPQLHNGGWTTRDCDGVTLWCHAFTYLAVPESYLPNEEETARIESGELMIGYGASEVLRMESSFVQFELEGALYNLLSMDGTGVETLCAMAEEIIRASGA